VHPRQNIKSTTMIPSKGCYSNREEWVSCSGGATQGGQVTGQVQDMPH
jgi:hypothetical protein